MTINHRIIRPFALLMIVLLVLTGCGAALPAAGPQVIVTRVPLMLEQSGAAADEPAALESTPIVEPSADFNFVQLGEPEATPVAEPSPLPQPVVSVPVTRSASSAVEAAPVAPVLSQPAPDDTLRPLQQTHNILLLGSDQRTLGYAGRTDTIMVLGLDEANGRAALVSIPRDVYLPIPGVGYSRINTAFGYGEERQPGGGIALLSSTIEKNFGIPIHNYVRVDIQGFEEIVDALGGVDVTVDCDLYDEKFPGYFGVYTLEAGDYHMDGRQALYYARSRKSTSDFDRARRQQRVLLAIRRRVLEADLLPRVPALYMALRDTVDTDLGPGDIAALARWAAGFKSENLFGMVLRYPLVEDWVTPQGGMVQLPDLPAIANALDNIWTRAPLMQTNAEERLCP
ncbi:MAG: LCP family protein [Caldilineae bacterium]|nr:LCP family protein [Anaerolineae bacterium]MCB0198954.1 LCP family protein [Anaerolineae bacterium]MCB0206160.1 LCP family protein [Anaerolineae bacterium]MCB0252689.1 LCP family protein [Anaerolineae bacterium]MCB9154662.1 LCP family protein [Caldilineae bacterium]